MPDQSARCKILCQQKAHLDSLAAKIVEQQISINAQQLDINALVAQVASEIERLGCICPE